MKYKFAVPIDAMRCNARCECGVMGDQNQAKGRQKIVNSSIKVCMCPSTLNPTVGDAIVSLWIRVEPCYLQR